MNTNKNLLSQDLSKKGKMLIDLYKEMVKIGYKTKDGIEVKNTYENFELKKFKEILLPEFNKLNIKTLLDYGGGGSDWEKKDFHDNKSAIDYFNLEKVINFEPARMKNELQISHCVTCFDVLEHVYFNDLNFVLDNIYSNAQKLVVLQIACYEASALLPTGENAHITIRPALWWKGFVDSFSIKYPKITTMLFCSSSYKKVHLSIIRKAEEHDEKKEFSVKLE